LGIDKKNRGYEKQSGEKGKKKYFITQSCPFGMRQPLIRGTVSSYKNWP